MDLKVSQAKTDFSSFQEVNSDFSTAVGNLNGRKVEPQKEGKLYNPRPHTLDEECSECVDVCCTICPR